MKQHLITGLWIVIAGLLGAGVLVLVGRPPAGEPIALLPPPTDTPIVVHVAGAVAQPGVYSLAPGSRVEDALAAAGGLLPQADETRLNLAARLVDGEKITVPEISAASEPAQRGGDLSQLLQPETPGDELININTASQVQLETLPGIGPSLAQQIINYREENGFFQTIEDLLKVPGIGQAKLENIRNLIKLHD